jgi:hypothetical protein
MNVTVNTAGIAFALTLIFVAGKLLGFLVWDWLWVLSPLWIWAGLGVVFFILGFLFTLLAIAISFLIATLVGKK